MNEDLLVEYDSVQAGTDYASADLTQLLDPLLWIFLLLSFVFLLYKLLPIIFARNRHQRHIVLKVLLPKDKSGQQDKKESTIQEIREDIAKAETMFASVGGLKAQKGFNAWLFGRDDHFSFEIVADHQRITYYISAPLSHVRYIQQQIQAHYPDSSVEKVADYNIFKPDSVILANALRTNRDFIYPLKTYHKTEADLQNGILNVLSKLDEGEAIAVQYVVRSANAVWHYRIAEIVRKVRGGKKMSDVISRGYLSQALSVLSSLVSEAKPKDQKDLSDVYRLTPLEEETLKLMEEKNAKAGLDVNLRLVVSARSQIKAKLYLDNLAAAYSQYNYYQYGNSIRPAKVWRLSALMQNFIYRRFNDKQSFLLNTEELASLYHFPLRNSDTPGIEWLQARHAPAPNDLPTSGTILGYNLFRGQKRDVRITRNDRLRHSYIIGKSGVGKTVLISSMAIQDILAGDGVCVLDPHGDLIDAIIKRIPPERAEDVIIFAPADIERPLAMNLMEFDPRFPEQKTFVINEIINIFDKLYDLKSTGGPIFEQYMRNSMLLVMSDPDSGSTLMEIPKVLADAQFRQMKLSRCSDQTVVEFWKKEAEKAGGDAALANVVPYITSKLTQFISNDMMRPIIGQQKSAFNFRDVMDKQKILLVDMPKGQVGEMNSFLLGMIIVGKILMAALSRSNMSEDERKSFYLYIDEFQNFTTDSIKSILSEARKYGLGLTIAHQYIGQLVKGQDSSIRDAVFGNVGTIMSFKVGADDAQYLEKEFAPVFNQHDLVNVEKHTVYTKLLIENASSRPFSMHTLWPLPGQKNETLAQHIRNLSRLKYGQDRRIIEAEILRRSAIS